MPTANFASFRLAEARSYVPDHNSQINEYTAWMKELLRLKSIFASDLNPICPVQPSAEKYSASVVGQISGLNPTVSPEGGALRTSRTLRWDAVAVLDATDERAQCGRRSRVVLAPRCWR
jgi:hypothetical protein